MLRRLAGRCLMGAGALMLALTAVTSSFAQGMFYAEETKDGRVYVFNIKANWERFKASGETGTGLTRLSVGPERRDRLRRQRDGARAVLLQVRHQGGRWSGRTSRSSASSSATARPRITAGDNFYMEMSNRIQLRFTERDAGRQHPAARHGRPRATARAPSASAARSSSSRAGSTSPGSSTRLQLNWTDVHGHARLARLEDANIDWDVTKGKKTFRVRFGQFKAPYGRQQITSSGTQQFVDRSIVDERYNPGPRDGRGALGHARHQQARLARAWSRTATSAARPLNDNDKFLYSARLMWQPNGATRMNQWGSGALLTEGDLDSTDKPLFAIAGQLRAEQLLQRHHRQRPEVEPVRRRRDLQVPGLLGCRRVHDCASSTPETGAEFDDTGYHVQASLRLQDAEAGPGRVPGVAGRYATIDPTDLVNGNDRKEVGGAISYYYNRHILKIQADFRQIEDEAANSGRGTRTRSSASRPSSSSRSSRSAAAAPCSRGINTDENCRSPAVG